MKVIFEREVTCDQKVNRANDQKKLEQESSMNGLGKPIKKKSYHKNWKKNKNQSKNCQCEQTKNQFFTVFSLLKSWSEKMLHHKSTRFFAPFLVPARPKSSLQNDFKNQERV